MHRGPPPHGLDGTPQFRLKPMYSTPPSNRPVLVRSMARFANSRTLYPSPFWLVFAPPKASGIRDKKTRIRCLDRLAECSFWNPSGSDRRDPTHSRRTGSKLGRLHRARQGLVRVPESNTKYGGKRGKTGGGAWLSCAAKYQ